MGGRSTPPSEPVSLRKKSVNMKNTRNKLTLQFDAKAAVAATGAERTTA